MPAPDVMGMLWRLLQSSPPAATPLGGTDQQFAQTIAQQAGVRAAPDTEGEDVAPAPPPRPRTLIEALSNYPPGGGADDAYWNYLRELYGTAPPDQRTGSNPQVNVAPGQGDRGVWTGQLQARLPLYDTDMPPEEPVVAGAGVYPVVPRGQDRSQPRDFVWNDAPPSHYWRRGEMLSVPQPRDPWAMLRTTPLNQMFGARRIPGLY